MKPLQGTFVLDLTRHLPGPYCGMLLADFGADVVKVEGLEGDPVRHLPPFVEQEGAKVSLAFRSINAGKRSLAIDLKTSEGRALFLDLAAQADVVLDGFRPGVLDRLGLGESVLRARHEKIVVAALTGYGSEGPYRDRAGHDLTYQAFAGALDGNRDDAGTSVVPGLQVADMGGALAAFSGIVLALLARERTGKGQSVSASLMGAAVALQPLQLVPPARGEPAQAAHVLTGASPCYRVYRTKDGRSVALAGLEPKFWDEFCDLVSRPEWVGHGHDPSLRGEVAALVASKTWEEWRLLEGAECCLAGVLSAEDASRDPQIQALGLIMDGPDGKAARLAPPLSLGGVPRPGTLAPVTTGQHTVEVLRERLGMDPDTIQRLRERRVLG